LNFFHLGANSSTKFLQQAIFIYKKTKTVRKSQLKVEKEWFSLVILAEDTLNEVLEVSRGR